MKQFKSVDELLDFAIDQEETAYNFYSDLADKAKKPGVDQLLREIAKEELDHKEKLLKIKRGGSCSISSDDVENINLSDYPKDVGVPDEDTSCQEVLLIAINRKKDAVNLYSELLNMVDTNEFTDILNLIILEEKKHGLRLEFEYEKHILIED